MDTKKERTYLSQWQIINLLLGPKKPFPDLFALSPKHITEAKAHITMPSTITPALNDPFRHESRKIIHIEIACPTTREKKARSALGKLMSKRKDMESPRKKLTTIKKIHRSM
ncbi:MAG: hypothetical protein N2V75_04305 [Methanophagales archaeon]|nr:hypothetical protein [Methanophagales archaeon]RLG35248.1 MAG: hypothetical protein DRN97_00345 [Methanosarcinales archaeon]